MTSKRRLSNAVTAQAYSHSSLVRWHRNWRGFRSGGCVIFSFEGVQCQNASTFHVNSAIIGYSEVWRIFGEQRRTSRLCKNNAC